MRVRGESVQTHLRRFGVRALNIVINRPGVFWLIGWANKRLRVLETVFVAYPASEKYARAYVHPSNFEKLRWSPWLVGAFRQDGKWGLMFVVSSTERDFGDEDNTNNLADLVERTERMRQLLGASQKSFAGILPGVLFARRILRDTVEADVTVKAVAQAERQVREKMGYEADVPVLILGALGFIGRRLAAYMSDRDVVLIDIHGGDPWPEHLRGQNAIAINATRRGALDSYTGLWWPELVLLNEIYPEPRREVVAQIGYMGAVAFHVVGVEARSFPPFPGAYAGGIPCCAARQTDAMRTIVRRLV